MSPGPPAGQHRQTREFYWGVLPGAYLAPKGTNVERERGKGRKEAEPPFLWTLKGEGTINQWVWPVQQGIIWEGAGYSLDPWSVYQLAIWFQLSFHLLPLPSKNYSTMINCSFTVNCNQRRGSHDSKTPSSLFCCLCSNSKNTTISFPFTSSGAQLTEAAGFCTVKPLGRADFWRSVCSRSTFDKKHHNVLFKEKEFFHLYPYLKGSLKSSL